MDSRRLDDRDGGAIGRRLGGFVGWSIVSAAAAFLLLLVVARVANVSGWNAIVVGQATGAFAAVVTSLGWVVTGPARVAAASSLERRRLYALSLRTRACVFALAAPLAALAAGVITGDWLIAPLTALSLAATGLLPAWYCVGLGRPSLVAIYEIIPRLAGSALAALAVAWSGQLIYYPILLLIPTLVTLVIFRPGPRNEIRLTWREVSDEFADQRHVAFASIFWASSGTLPVPIVAAVASSSALATFAVADKMYRAGVFGIQALASSFQGWVAEPQPNQRRRRMLIATASHLALGVLGLLAFGLAGPAVSGFLFGDDLAADAATCWLFGVATLALALSSSLGSHWLAVARRNRALFLSAVGGTVVGLPLTFVLAASFGAAGGAGGIAAGEVTVCLVQIGALIGRRTGSEHQ